jgi:hypothetical protein
MSDTERMDWLERVNPIVFSKTSEDDGWELVVDAHLTNGVGRSYVGDTLRQVTDFAMAGEVSSKPQIGEGSQ